MFYCIWRREYENVWNNKYVFLNMLILKFWYLRLRSVVNIPVFAVQKESETFEIDL